MQRIMFSIDGLYRLMGSVRPRYYSDNSLPRQIKFPSAFTCLIDGTSNGRGQNMKPKYED
jgi:hypothetical protein